MTHPFEDPRSAEADELAAEADRLVHQGAFERARTLFLRAADLERELCLGTPGKLPKVRAVFAVNAAMLCMKARAYDTAMKRIDEFLSEPKRLHREGIAELKELRLQCARLTPSMMATEERALPPSWRDQLRRPFLPPWAA